PTARTPCDRAPPARGAPRCYTHPPPRSAPADPLLEFSPRRLSPGEVANYLPRKTPRRSNLESAIITTLRSPSLAPFRAQDLVQRQEDLAAGHRSADMRGRALPTMPRTRPRVGARSGWHPH